MAPIRDHTTGLASGRYALLKSAIYKYFSSDSPHIMTALALNTTADHCLSFWHYDDSEFNYMVVVKISDSKELESEMGEITLQPENRRKWNFYKVDFTEMKLRHPLKPFNIVIRFANQDVNGIKTPEELVQYTKFAIDDIKLRPGLCGHQTDYVYTFDSTFEDLQVENIQPVVSNSFDLFNPESKPDSIPAFDHTSGKGKYAKFHSYSTGLHENDYNANSLSIVNLQPDNDLAKCVRFAYQLSPNVTLKAFVMSSNENEYDFEHDDQQLAWHAEK